MSGYLEWDDFRAEAGLMEVTISLAALLLALEQGAWRGVDFQQEDYNEFLQPVDPAQKSVVGVGGQVYRSWKRCHSMARIEPSGAVKAARDAICFAIRREIDAGRMKSTSMQRSLDGTIDPSRSKIDIDAAKACAALFGIELGDLWEQFESDEVEILNAALDSASHARTVLEHGESVDPGLSARLAELPVWAQAELLKCRQSSPGPQLRVEPQSEKKLGARERRKLLNTIGALVEIIFASTPGGMSHSVFKSQASLIDLLLASSPEREGIAQRTLEATFAAAKASLRN